MLSLPKNQHYKVPAADRCSSRLPRRSLGSGDKASLLFDLNENRLKLPGPSRQTPRSKSPSQRAGARRLSVVGRVSAAGWQGLVAEKPPTAGGMSS